MSKAESENRKIRRRYKTLARKGRVREEKEQMYADNKGQLYRFKFIARISSFYNILVGCLHNGFPIAVPKLWYNAWAVWPFFFVKQNLALEDPIPTLNHERIHVRQQWDIMVTFAPFILALCFYMEFKGMAPYPLIVIPFLPTILYGVAMVFSFFNLKKRGEKITFHSVRENTWFERESISKALNYDYLHTRKFWAVLAYTGIGLFKNYGIK